MQFAISVGVSIQFKNMLLIFLACNAGCGFRCERFNCIELLPYKMSDGVICECIPNTFIVLMQVCLVLNDSK